MIASSKSSVDNLLLLDLVNSKDEQNNDTINSNLGRFNSELHENSSSSSFLSSLSLNATYLGSDENEKSLSLKISTNSIATQKNRTEFFIFESTSSLTPQTTTNTKSTNTESKDNYPPTTLQNNDSATPNFTENNHNFSKIFQLTKFKNLKIFSKNHLF